MEIITIITVLLISKVWGEVNREHPLFFFFLAVPRSMRDPSSLTRNRTCTPCVEWSLNHWTVMEILNTLCFKLYCQAHHCGLGKPQSQFIIHHSLLQTQATYWLEHSQILPLFFKGKEVDTLNYYFDGQFFPM